MIGVTGVRTTIVNEYRLLAGQPVYRMLESDMFIPPEIDMFVFAAGVLYPKNLSQLSVHESIVSFKVNLLWQIRLADRVLRANDRASVCLIGSESAFKGSYDELYAVLKAALHAFVRNRKIKKTQRLFCVAPPIIADSGMTLRRHDYPEVLTRRKTVTAKQVAEKIHFEMTSESRLGRPEVILMGDGTWD